MDKTEIGKKQTVTEMQDLSQSGMITTTYDIEKLIETRVKMDPLLGRIKQSLSKLNDFIEHDNMDSKFRKNEVEDIHGQWKEIAIDLGNCLKGDETLPWEAFHSTIEKFIFLCLRAKYCVSLWEDIPPELSPTYRYLASRFPEFMKKDDDGDPIPVNKFPNKNCKDNYKKLNKRLCRLNVRQKFKGKLAKEHGTGLAKTVANNVEGSIPIAGGFLAYGLDKLLDNLAKQTSVIDSKLLVLGANPTVPKLTWQSISYSARTLNEKQVKQSKAKKYGLIDLEDETE